MPAVTLLIGDTRETLATLPAASAQTCITSPPYYGLRDYGTAQWAGGDPACDHLQGRLVSRKSTLRTDGREHTGPYDGEKAVATGMPYRDLCGKCGARREDTQIGLEASVDAYVAALVDVFRAVRRVLRPDGTLWLNLGDSYTNAGQAGSRGSKRGTGKPGWTDGGALGDKQLLGIPWRVAFALQADGWVLRSDIIWAKPNAMPESVTDRPTKAHEYLFLLAPSARYYYDAAAIAEPSISPPGRTWEERKARGPGKNAGVSWRQDVSIAAAGTIGNGISRNKRTVWTVATRPYKGAHFATFPPDLIRPCVLAGTSAAGQCAVCGAPWARVTEHTKGTAQAYQRPKHLQSAKSTLSMSGGSKGWDDIGSKTVTTGWQPTCRCDAGDPVPQTVLDPFAGSGTTGAVALECGRAAVLCELNPAYAPLIRARLATVQPTLVQEGAA